MTNQQIADTLAVRGWTAEVTPNTGRWRVGPETSEGILDAWGEGDELEKAVNNALESERESLANHGMAVKR